MTINAFTIIDAAECCRCAACDAPLAVGDEAREYGGRVFCSTACVHDEIGRAVAEKLWRERTEKRQ